MCIARAASAQTVNWTGASGNWNDANNWTPMTVPASGVSAALTQSDAFDRTVNFISAAPTNLNWVNVDAFGSGRITLSQMQDTLGAATLSLGTATTQFGIYNQSGGTLTATAQFVGANGAGTFIHSGGTNQTSGFLSVGDGSSAFGNYIMSNSAVVNINEIYVGYSGTGTLSMSGGEILGPLNSFLSAGYNANANGTILLSAGTIGTLFNYVGGAGNGTLIQNGGVLNAPQFVSIGDSATGRGTYRLQTGTLSANELDVAFNGLGTFTQTGGVANISGPIIIANGPASRGTLTVSAGALSAISTNVNANGTVNFNGGAMSLGALTVNNGRVIVAPGGGKILVANSLTLSGSGFIDLNDDDMIIKGGNTYADISGKVFAARNAGSWNGTGITSTAAKIDLVKNKTLAVVRGSEYRDIDAMHTTFRNQPVANGDILIRYTYYGDANFNGKVDGGDYARLDTTFNNELQFGNIGGWINGDFDYNGKVDGADYGLIDAAFASQTGTLGLPTPQAGPVPEPTTLLTLSALGGLLLSRVRRK